VYVCVCVSGQMESSVLKCVCETTKQNVVHVSSKAENSAQRGEFTLHLLSAHSVSLKRRREQHLLTASVCQPLLSFADCVAQREGGEEDRV